MLAINRQLQIVIPIIRGDETKLYVHASPIRHETFETYHMVLAKTFSALAQNGLDPRSGPSVAGLILTDVAKNTARAPGISWWEGNDGVGGPAGLLAEMIRLSNAIVPSAERGWVPMPLQLALDKGLVDEEERSEVTNLLTFFTVASRVAPRADRERLIQGTVVIYELLSTFLNATDFATSLRTLKAEEPSGESEAA